MCNLRVCFVCVVLCVLASRLTGQESTKLVATDAAANDEFGASVAANGNIALVGAPRDDTTTLSTGSAFLFQRNNAGTWTFLKKVVASTRGGGDDFGRSVTIKSGIALVGAPGEDDQGSEAGAAFIFEKDLGGAGTWGERKKIYGSDAGSGAAFGTSTALEGASAVVGAPGALNQGAATGAAYVFGQNTGGANVWGQVTKLTGPAAAGGSQFGMSLAFQQETIAIGAPGDSDNANAAGAAYIFKRDATSNWVFVIKITTPEPQAGARFASAVALDGSRLAVGASQSGTAGPGAVFIFERDRGGADHWGFVRMITAPEATAGAKFGATLAMESGLLVVGAPADSRSGTNAGASYVFYRDQGGTDQYGQAAWRFGSDSSALFEVGSAVALMGRTALVGAVGDNHQGNRSGSVYVFDPAAGAPRMNLTFVLNNMVQVDWAPASSIYALDKTTDLNTPWQVVAEAAMSPVNFPLETRAFFRLRPHDRVEIRFVPVGNPLNEPDASGYGAAAEPFQIDQFEVTNLDYARFLNAVASSADPNGLYNPAMSTDPRGGIQRTGGAGSFVYTPKANMTNKPVVYVSYYDALRFANWLHNGQPFGQAQATENGAYTFTSATAVSERLAGAKVWLPNENEWYKAAYYDPTLGPDGYHLYPTRNEATPDLATANAVGDISNPGANVANFSNGAIWNGQVGNVTSVGSAGSSRSFYGTFDMGGNVAEWTEDANANSRVIRGGSWSDFEANMESPSRSFESPTTENNLVGFRVARP